MNQEFDLLVIGAGSGGVAAARRAASHGAKVAIVECDRVGGTCVIRGCIPKKLMMYASAFAGLFKEAAGYGWRVDGARFDMAAWAEGKARELDRLEAVYEGLLTDSGVSLLRGAAVLQGDGVVRVGDRQLRADKILLATGGAPSTDAFDGLATAMSSNDVLALKAVPDSILVIGGGYIAVEFASILAGLGCQVSMAFRDQLPLRGFDEDLRRRLAEALDARGIVLAGSVGMSKLEQPQGAGGAHVLHRADGSLMRAEFVLNATGRRANTAGLGLGNAGVRMSDKGAILVDVDSRTTAAGIWAVGDVTDRICLTPVAIAEGRAFADAAFAGSSQRMDHRLVASAVFTDPPLASVGLTEQEAVRVGPVDIYEADFRPMKSAFAGSPSRTYMKLVVDGLSHRVLGVHMLGIDAPEIVQSLAVALSCGASKSDFDRTIAVHPTAAEEFVLMRAPTRRHPGPSLVGPT